MSVRCSSDMYNCGLLAVTMKGCSAFHLIIIIIDFNGAYFLRNLSSEAQQNRISKRNRKQGRPKVNIRTRDNRTFMVGMQFGIYTS